MKVWENFHLDVCIFDTINVDSIVFSCEEISKVVEQYEQETRRGMKEDLKNEGWNSITDGLAHVFLYNQTGLYNKG